MNVKHTKTTRCQTFKKRMHNDHKPGTLKDEGMKKCGKQPQEGSEHLRMDVQWLTGGGGDNRKRVKVTRK